MSHTVAYKIHTIPSTHSNDRDHGSFFRIIATWLNKALMSHRPNMSTRYQHKSFMDANLLDDVMGPEISRTLRR